MYFFLIDDQTNSKHEIKFKCRILSSHHVVVLQDSISLDALFVDTFFDPDSQSEAEKFEENSQK